MRTKKADNPDIANKELRVKWPPKTVWDGMLRLAKKNRRSMAAEILVACEQYIAADEKASAKA